MPQRGATVLIDLDGTLRNNVAPPIEAIAVRGLPPVIEKSPAKALLRGVISKMLNGGPTSRSVAFEMTFYIYSYLIRTDGARSARSNDDKITDLDPQMVTIMQDAQSRGRESRIATRNKRFDKKALADALSEKGLSPDITVVENNAGKAVLSDGTKPVVAYEDDPIAAFILARRHMRVVLKRAIYNPISVMLAKAFHKERIQLVDNWNEAVQQ